MQLILETQPSGRIQENMSVQVGTSVNGDINDLKLDINQTHKENIQDKDSVNNTSLENNINVEPKAEDDRHASDTAIENVCMEEQAQSNNTNGNKCNVGNDLQENLEHVVENFESRVKETTSNESSSESHNTDESQSHIKNLDITVPQEEHTDNVDCVNSNNSETSVSEDSKNVIETNSKSENDKQQTSLMEDDCILHDVSSVPLSDKHAECEKSDLILKLENKESEGVDTDPHHSESVTAEDFKTTNNVLSVKMTEQMNVEESDIIEVDQSPSTADDKLHDSVNKTETHDDVKISNCTLHEIPECVDVDVIILDVKNDEKSNCIHEKNKVDSDVIETKESSSENTSMENTKNTSTEKCITASLSDNIDSDSQLELVLQDSETVNIVPETADTEKVVTDCTAMDIDDVEIIDTEEPKTCMDNSDVTIEISTEDLTEHNTVSKDSTEKSIVEDIDEDDLKIVENKTEECLTAVPEKDISSNSCNKPLTVCKLSNTLDILSDDEDEPQKPPPKENSDLSEKQCISIDDDDDIMLIEEDSNSKEIDIKPEAQEDASETKYSTQTSTDTTEGITMDIKEALSKNDEKDIAPEEIELDEKNTEIKNENSKDLKPLLPDNFLKTAKKNLADMSRDELEDFCILRIVESIVERSSLGDIKNRIKTMAHKLEEYRKKSLLLSKQNRDLQVVLKSVLEEQKKRAVTCRIQPLKITRSVGMQVSLTETLDNRRKGPIPKQVNSSAPKKPIRNTTNTKSTKTPALPIPFPRLVPANSPSNKTPATSPANNSPKMSSPAAAKAPATPQKAPEKRPLGRAPPGVTVDLTDDEPPPKVSVKAGPAPPVRLVPPQNLLASQRQFSLQLNSPRKVYIPISSPQGHNIKNGQTVILKNVPSPGVRAKMPPLTPQRAAGALRICKQQVSGRHPAPLPDAMKQYTPPTWKPLPPAPELKLSKVENGIVISWKIDGFPEGSYETVASYQLYAYQETSAPPSTALWKKIGDVKALPLPMACTLTQFMTGFKYYFAVRAVDIRSRFGSFSNPSSILLMNNVTAYNCTMEKEPDEPEDFTNEPLSSMSEPMEVEDAVASSLATLLTQPRVAASKSKAQKQREYRQRIAATRTPAQAAAARKLKTERQRNNRLRQATLAIASSSLEATTTSSSCSREESNNVQTGSQRQHAQQKFTTTADQPDERDNLTNEPLFPAIPVPMEVQEAVASISATPFAEPITATPKTRAQIQREYRQRIAVTQTPEQAAAAREARNLRERYNRLCKAANLAIATGSLQATTTSSSRSEQRLNTIYIDTQQQFTDQQRQTLATEPAETTVQPSTSSDQIEVQAQST